MCMFYRCVKYLYIHESLKQHWFLLGTLNEVHSTEVLLQRKIISIPVFLLRVL